MGYRNYSTSLGLMVDPNGKGDFTTVSAAVTVATAGKTVFVRPGTYTEDVALKAGVNITAFSGDDNQGNVTIIGKCSFSGVGTVDISNIRLQTNGDFLLSVTGSSASVVNLVDCFLNCVNSTGIQYTSSSASSSINIYNNEGNLVIAGISYLTATGAGSVAIIGGFYNNSGLSTTASTTSACPVSLYNSNFGSVFSTSGTGTINAYNCQLDSGLVNTAPITTAGTGTNLLYNNYFSSGTASAISIGAGTTVNLASSNITSSNANAITGAGTLNYAGITFTGSSSTVNTSTVNILPFVPGSATEITKIAVDTTTGGGTNPVVPSAGQVTFTGGQYATGTFGTRVLTINSGAANSLTIETQISSAVASTLITKNGMSHFDSALFTVDANGFVSGSTTGFIKTLTGDSGGARSPTANNINIVGGSSAAGTSPVAVAGASSTLTVNVQKSQAIASTDATKVGLATFNSSNFSVDANGFVSLISGGFTWSDKSTNFNAAAENGYFISGSCIATLPASPSNGDTIKFFVDGAFVVTITANTGQTIQIASNVSSSAGTQANTATGDACELVYRSTDTKWCAVNFVGAWNKT